MTLNFPSIFDEILAEVASNTSEVGLTTVNETEDYLNIGLEIPRLQSETVSVSVQKQGMRYVLFVEGLQTFLSSYLSTEAEKKAKTYNTAYRFTTSRPVALDGSLNLDYKEGVLMVGVPLQKPTEAKKQGLSARLV